MGVKQARWTLDLDVVRLSLATTLNNLALVPSEPKEHRVRNEQNLPNGLPDNVFKGGPERNGGLHMVNIFGYIVYWFIF